MAAVALTGAIFMNQVGLRVAGHMRTCRLHFPTPPLTWARRRRSLFVALLLTITVNLVANARSSLLRLASAASVAARSGGL